MASYEQAKSLLRHSVSRPTLFSLELSNSNVSRLTDKLTPEEQVYIKLFCENVTMPGVDHEQIMTIGQEDMGIARSVPAGMTFGAGGTLRFSVIENSDFGVYASLRKMFDSIHSQGRNPTKNARAQRLNYYNDYRFDVTLKKLEFPNGEKDIKGSNTNAIDYGYKVVATYTFERCHMNSIGSMSLSSRVQDTYLTFDASIKFETYHYDDEIYMSNG